MLGRRKITTRRCRKRRMKQMWGPA